MSILADYEGEAAARELLRRQNSDGGWSQSKEMASDAHATGQALYALLARNLHEAGNSALASARDYLLRTQLPDGSWPMSSRPRGDNVGSTSSENLEPITYAGSAWTVLALLQYLPSP